MSTELEQKFPGVTLGADKLRAKPRRMKCQYSQFTELIQHTGVGWDEQTNTVKASPDIWDKFIKMEEQFLACRNSRGKEPIDLEEGSGDSDEAAREVDDPVITGSRRRVRKRGSNTNSQMQELIDLYWESVNKKEKGKTSTHPESKKSKSVTSPEKPEKHSIEEAHSKETVSRVFNLILEGMQSLVATYVRPRNVEEQPEIRRCRQWYPFFRGSTHDSRILSDAATLPEFPAPRREQYYVVDAGFPKIPGYLAPYKGQRLFAEYGDAWQYYDEFRNPPTQIGIRNDVDMRSRAMDAVRDRIANQIWHAERGNILTCK
ncbi:hypothetical protein CRG98_030582 [Punica granatum]|uniref:Myb/SANT-like domain-containing protein n=1 Tax=Punica granatum TaxID=22663 RepID=A0A2I0IYG6_PUNGR|nr:hypothetical protein CRG98_030582 [Punica granatum]